MVEPFHAGLQGVALGADGFAPLAFRAMPGVGWGFDGHGFLLAFTVGNGSISAARF